MSQQTSQIKFLLTTGKILLLTFAALLITVVMFVVGSAGFIAFEQNICESKVDVTVKSFLEHVKGGNYENFPLKSSRRVNIFQSREDFNNFKQGVLGKYSVTIKEWEALMVFVRVEFASAPAYEITAMPSDSIVLCLGKDYKVVGVTRWE